MSSGTTYEAAEYSRLMSSWGVYYSEPDPVLDAIREGGTIASRVWRLVLNDPYSTSLMVTVVGEVLGTGLLARSGYQADDKDETSDEELLVRRAINLAIANHSKRFRIDANSRLSRIDLETQVLVAGFMSGDCFIVKQWNPDRPGAKGYATCWQVVRGMRVCNPDNKPNDDTWQSGLKLNANGDTIAIAIKLRTLPGGNQTARWIEVPMYAADGSINVIHYMPDRWRAEGLRGISKFAPLLVMARQLMAEAQSHVTGKRIQSDHVAFMKVNDPKKAAEAAKAASIDGASSPVARSTIAYIGKDADVVIPNWTYNGQDHSIFVETHIRAFTAAWGYPWQYVLRQLTNSNMASAQAALDQTEKTSTGYQNTFITYVKEPMDESIVREAEARGRIIVPVPDMERLADFTYQRPRRADANRQRTREAATTFVKLGGSLTKAFAEMGYDFEDEVRQRKQDDAFLAAQGVEIDLGGKPAEPAPAPAADPAADPGDQPEDPPGDEPADPAADPSQTDTGAAA